jgi:hypothetical protein
MEADEVHNQNHVFTVIDFSSRKSKAQARGFLTESRPSDQVG